MVADLLRGFVQEDWVKDFDFDNLNELQEVRSMLAERVIEWTEEWEQQGLQESRQEECISLVTRLLIRKFGIHPELGPSLVQLQTLPVEKLQDLAEEMFDWTEVSDLTEWLRQQRVEFNYSVFNIE